MKTNLAYLAGYCDGDGCFYIGKNISPIKYRSGIIISSTNKDVLRFFKKTFGGNIAFGKKNKKFRTYNIINQWIIGGSNSLNLAKQLMSYLVEKANDAKLFISFQNEKCKSIKDSLIQETRIYRATQNLVTPEEVQIINNISYKGIQKDEDYAYLAGFIDSECCFTISKYKPKNRPNTTYKILLQCNNTKTGTIYWLKSTFGGSCNFVPRKHRNQSHKDQTAWRISGNALSKILPNLLPFLKNKRIICEKLIEFYSTTMDNGGDRQSKKFRKDYTETLNVRNQIVDQIHILNSKII